MPSTALKFQHFRHNEAAEGKGCNSEDSVQGEEASSENEGKEIGFPQGVAHIASHVSFSCSHILHVQHSLHVSIFSIFNPIFSFSQFSIPDTIQINHPINSVWVVPSPTVTRPGACDLLAVRSGKRKKPQDLALIPPKGRKVELGELSDLSAVAFLDKWFPFSYFIFFRLLLQTPTNRLFFQPKINVLQWILGG